MVNVLKFDDDEGGYLVKISGVDYNLSDLEALDLYKALQVSIFGTDPIEEAKRQIDDIRVSLTILEDSIV